MERWKLQQKMLLLTRHGEQHGIMFKKLVLASKKFVFERSVVRRREQGMRKSKTSEMVCFHGADSQDHGRLSVEQISKLSCLFFLE